MKVIAIAMLLVSTFNTTVYANECYDYFAKKCKSQRDGLWYLRNGCANGGDGMAEGDAWRCENDPIAMEQLNKMDIDAKYSGCLSKAIERCK